MDDLARAPAGPAGRRQDAELIQNEVYEAGKDAGFEPLRAWFSALYEVLLGQSQGPRFGSFAAIFGLADTIALIERALAGEDLSARAIRTACEPLPKPERFGQDLRRGRPSSTSPPSLTCT